MPITVGSPISEADIFLMMPMSGLKNCWAMQGGRAGEYFTAVVVRTDETGEVAQ
jgi:hypothetical protein